MWNRKIILARILSVVAGFVPAIHVFLRFRKQDVDARHKAGNDGLY